MIKVHIMPMARKPKRNHDQEEIRAWVINWEYGKSGCRNLSAIENIYCFVFIMVILPF